MSNIRCVRVSQVKTHVFVFVGFACRGLCNSVMSVLQGTVNAVSPRKNLLPGMYGKDHRRIWTLRYHHWLVVIGVYVKKYWCKYTALWKSIALSSPLAFLLPSATINCLFPSIIWMNLTDEGSLSFCRDSEHSRWLSVSYAADKFTNTSPVFVHCDNGNKYLWQSILTNIVRLFHTKTAYRHWGTIIY